MTRIPKKQNAKPRRAPRTAPPRTYCPECGGPSSEMTPIGSFMPKTVQLHTVECSRREEKVMS